LKQLCGHSTNIQVILWLQADLPSESLIDIFWGESIFGIQLTSNVFINNSKNFPVLSKRHQAVLKKFMKS
jgi:protein arginine N-methyltransferase 5